MTVIAANREVMASDSLVTCSGQRNYHTSKIWRVNERIFGAAGDCPAIAKFRRWIEDPGSELPEFDEKDDIEVIELSPSGIWLWDKGLLPDKFEDAEQTYAIGGIGAGVALYVMRCLNKGPIEAVREACRIDTECGGPCRFVRLTGAEGVDGK